MSDPPPSQTLSRGIRLLEVLAETGPLSIADLADVVGLHRSITYRLVRTLEHHDLVDRDTAGRARLAPGLAALARSVAADLRTAAGVELGGVADDLGLTAFLAVQEHADCVTIATVEPRRGGTTIAQRPGIRHPLTVGAPGIAISSLLADDVLAGLGGGALRPEVATTRARGWAATRDEVVAGLGSVAVPLGVPHQPPAALAVVFLATADEAALAARLAQAAQRVRARLG